MARNVSFGRCVAEAEQAEASQVLPDGGVLPPKPITLYNDLRDRGYDYVTAVDSPCGSEAGEPAHEHPRQVYAAAV